MLGQVAGKSGISPSAARYFRYEVVGLRQNEETDNNGYQIRSSASTFITVPYSRMNEEMRRIARLGGRIVNIHPVGQETGAAEASASEE